MFAMRPEGTGISSSKVLFAYTYCITFSDALCASFMYSIAMRIVVNKIIGVGP